MNRFNPATFLCLL